MVTQAPGHKAPAGKSRHAGTMTGAADRIRARLTEAFAPASLEVVDESDLHKGHAGHRPEGDTHFRVRIAAEAFRGKTRVEAHRMVNAAMKGEFDRGLHALAIEAKAPG
jgi:BolA protein